MKMNKHTTKEEVLNVLTKLREDVLSYADYNHYMEYDYNVELTLVTLDNVIEAVEMPNEKYGVNHIINSLVTQSKK
jgi:hypothetical protein|tara:strand:+ start:2740 stop:2967 length:228 start_codon:yes stop_codon:yes gene_type:complete